MELKRIIGLTSKSFATIFISPYFPGLARDCQAKKKRPSRENRTPKAPGPRESTINKYYIKHKALMMPTINILMFQPVIAF
jgi:hypothetical protein